MSITKNEINLLTFNINAIVDLIFLFYTPIVDNKKK